LLLRIAEQVNLSGAKLVTIIGGEPFTLEHLPQVVSLLLELPGREVNIDTNGTYLKSRWSPVYERVNRINISLDDISPQIHNLQRGAHSAVIDCIDILSRRSVAFGCNITVTSRNYQNIFRTAKFALDQGAKVIGFGRLKQIGRGSESFAELDLTASQRRTAVNQILAFFERHHSQVTIHASGFYSEELFERGVVRNLPSCLCGDRKLTIDHDGLVYPCEVMPFVFSSQEVEHLFGRPLELYKYPLHEILQSNLMRFWRERVYDKPDDCSSCKYRLYCSSGCRAMTYRQLLDFNRKDPSCSIGQENGLAQGRLGAVSRASSRCWA